MKRLKDRSEAGRLLANELRDYEGRADAIVVALPRGGVAVGCEIARILRLPLDVLVVRKVGVPWEPELAMGAIASGGIRILDRALIDALHISSEMIMSALAKAEDELKGREAYFRRGSPAHDLAGRAIILVDDGAATGSTLLAAAEAVRVQQPIEIVMAVPVASRQAHAAFRKKAAKSICLGTPEPFFAVGQWYKSFPQLTDEEVRRILDQSRRDESQRPESQSP